MSYSRYALYFVPPPGALAEFGAQWLGWDMERATDVTQPAIDGLREVTQAPQKYGFHATLKPPFRLVPEMTAEALTTAVEQFAARCAPTLCRGLTLTALGRFLALTPLGDASGLSRVAAECVEAIDPFRAASTEEEFARRRTANLSDRQNSLLLQWGYPYVMEEFRFHMTLTGRLPRREVTAWQERLQERLPPLPAPFVLDAVSLVGEREDGRFELIRRYPLLG